MSPPLYVCANFVVRKFNGSADRPLRYLVRQFVIVLTRSPALYACRVGLRGPGRRLAASHPWVPLTISPAAAHRHVGEVSVVVSLVSYFGYRMLTDPGPSPGE